MSGFGSLQNSNNNDDCLDLPSKRIYVLVFFAVSDLGHEYEIFERNELGCSSWCCLSVGSPIDIKYGPARTRGEIVKVSGKLSTTKYIIY